MSVEERVHDLLAPVVATVDVELIDVEYTGGLLRVTIDEESGITSERLAEVNRLVSPILDQHDPIPGRYTLEVTSPGLERPLRTMDHCRRAIGESIAVKLGPGHDIRRVRGELLAVDESGVGDGTLVVDAAEIDGVELDENEERRIDRSTIATARTVFKWGPGPKPGQPGAKKNKKSNAKSSKTRNTASKTSKNPSQREVRDEQ